MSGLITFPLALLTWPRSSAPTAWRWATLPSTQTDTTRNPTTPGAGIWGRIVPFLWNSPAGMGGKGGEGGMTSRLKSLKPSQASSFAVAQVARVANSMARSISFLNHATHAWRVAFSRYRLHSTHCLASVQSPCLDQCTLSYQRNRRPSHDSPPSTWW